MASPQEAREALDKHLAESFPQWMNVEDWGLDEKTEKQNMLTMSKFAQVIE